jgi:hypothetical protein
MTAETVPFETLARLATSSMVIFFIYYFGSFQWINLSTLFHSMTTRNGRIIFYSPFHQSPMNNIKRWYKFKTNYSNNQTVETTQ